MNLTVSPRIRGYGSWARRGGSGVEKGGDACVALIGMKVRKSPSAPVGARVAGRAFMVVRGWGCCLFIKEPASTGVQRQATINIKAILSLLHHPRSYGSLGLLPASMASPYLHVMPMGGACVALVEQLLSPWF